MSEAALDPRTDPRFDRVRLRVEGSLDYRSHAASVRLFTEDRDRAPAGSSYRAFAQLALDYLAALAAASPATPGPAP